MSDYIHITARISAVEDIPFIGQVHLIFSDFQVKITYLPLEK